MIGQKKIQTINLNNRFFRYVLTTLDQLIAEDYVLIYLHGATTRSNMPSFAWLKVSLVHYINIRDTFINLQLLLIAKIKLTFFSFK